MADALMHANSERHGYVHAYRTKHACANTHHDHISDMSLRGPSRNYTYRMKIHKRISLF